VCHRIRYIERKQKKFIGRIVDALPDSLPLVLKMRMTITEFPDDEAGEFPPMYKKRLVPKYKKHEDDVNIITVGRRGQIGEWVVEWIKAAFWSELLFTDNLFLHPFSCDKASDSAFVAMILSAKKIIRLGLQDLGPVCIPRTKIALPGCTWPHTYLNALGKVIWEKGVDVEIVLSNPGSIPGGLTGTEANYGNGWSCVDVAAEIIKSIRKQFPKAEDDQLRKKVAENLRVCFLRTGSGNKWADGMNKGMHAKHFIVDDVACYVGSQNLYVCDLAEWGVVVDDRQTTVRMKAEYWDPMWKASYTGKDVDVQKVMDGLDIDRDGENPGKVSPQQLAAAALATSHFPSKDYCKDHDSDSDWFLLLWEQREVIKHFCARSRQLMFQV
jgi:phosphatidylserine/phosphatidylglycerophosphate/cardiolipin synthase-like enzyme